MVLFSIQDNKLEELREVPFFKEVELHKLCEANLESLFGLEFVRREFALNNFRIDTLAFDKSTKSFVIIEYKNTRNFSVIDQGYAYLSLLVNNKADFILEYNENTNEPLKREDVDWSQSRVIFVSPEFNNYQTESIKTIATTSEIVKSVNKEIKVITEEHHFNQSTEEFIDIYNSLKEYILALDSNIRIRCTGAYIGFILNNRNMVDILPRKKQIKVWLNCKWGSLDNTKNIFRDVSKIGHWGNGDYEASLTNDENIEYIFSLIKQVYKLKK